MTDRSLAGDYLEYLPLTLLRRLTAPMPPAMRGRVAAWTARRALRNVPHLRARVMDNLALVYPDMDQTRREAILTGMAAHVGRTLMEVLHAEDFRETTASFTVAGDGLAVLLAQRDAGKGAVVVSGHFGQWEAVRACLRANGMEAGGIFRPLHNRFSNRLLTPKYAAFGSPLFPKGRTGMREIIRHLQKGRFLGALHDQKMDDGILLDFMGQPAATSPVVAELALRFKLPLVPAYATRGADLTSIHVEFEPPVPHTTAREMAQALNDSLAARVHARPEQYYWLHRRWQVRNPRHLAELTAAARQQ